MSKKQKNKHKTVWRIWAKALGEKGSKCDREADIIAICTDFYIFHLSHH